MQNLQSYFLLLHKPVGITSQKLLNQLKRHLPQKTKVGHHGTLDPFASGLMLVGINEACKFFRFVDDHKKTYEATLKLGIATDTLDKDGTVISQQKVDVNCFDAQNINAVFQSFLGKSEQTPPMFSAIKVDGKRLYELARAGQEVARQPREIEIFALELKEIAETSQTISFAVSCSRGTYVRSLALDIAKKLHTIGHLQALTRTKLVGKNLEKAFRLAHDEGLLEQSKIPICELLNHYPKIDLTEKERIDLFHGKIISLQEGMQQNQIVSLFENEKFLGMGEIQCFQNDEQKFLKSLRLIKTV